MATEIEIKNLKEQFADIKTATRSNISLIYKVSKKVFVNESES